MIEKKGYSREEAVKLADKVFNEHENDAMPVEWYIGKILPKEEWEKEIIC